MGDRRGCAIASMSSYVLGVDITGGAAEMQGSWRLQVGSRGEMAAWFSGRAEAEVCQYPEVGGMSPSARGIGAIGRQPCRDPAAAVKATGGDSCWAGETAVLLLAEGGSGHVHQLFEARQMGF
ncbi:hypothetical protein MLD38_025818 [Melastoma candidum]|uniref:Uncharacterized protein n=1 Tax=Melastoma candidum TaxID=119954 RepID=A0ACB9P3G7_9MYRT|nr:hypothetical protein MLD38_025818 [Melastoma candidum]